MVRVVPTRWNSLVEAIQRALFLRPAIERLLSQTKYSKRGKDGLVRFKLSTKEWKLLEELDDLLTVYFILF